MGDVDDLVTWLRAQLDEDEQIAREAAEEGDGQWRLATYQDGTTTAWHGEAEVMTSLDGTDAVHIRNWDPARVLAEVDAKRRILDEVVDEATGLDMQVDGEFRVGRRDEAAEPYLGNVLMRMLALPFADRPGYRNEWKP